MRVRLAAYQAPLDACVSLHDPHGILALLREQIVHCESIGATFLCCPEAAIGGLADYTTRPADIALHADSEQLVAIASSLASDTVTSIVGFTEVDGTGTLYNAAAVIHRGAVVGVYRKLHPAIRRSVYSPGTAIPVFTVNGVTFGIIICRDSAFAEPARAMAAQGASVLFIPTNNGLPPAKGGAELIDAARRCDIALATEHQLVVVRADVAGSSGELVSHGSSAIVGQHGNVVASARSFLPELIVADVDT